MVNETHYKHRQASQEAVAILERTMEKTKKYPISREDDWSITRAIAALREIPQPHK